MTKKYFTKYLPIEENMLLVGGMYWNKQHSTADLITSSFHLDILKKGNFQLAKLFLCSRDIQVGDKAGILNDEFYGEADTPVTKKNLLFFDRPDAFKVIGEISPDALSYIKEGDEFSGEDIRDGIEHPNGNSVKWKNDDGLPVYEVKGPCGHFH